MGAGCLVGRDWPRSALAAVISSSPTPCDSYVAASVARLSDGRVSAEVRCWNLLRAGRFRNDHTCGQWHALEPAYEVGGDAYVICDSTVTRLCDLSIIRRDGTRPPRPG
ncbi:hypothetical protein GCM10020220_095440 [Nonomuraea rubra]